MERFYRRCSSRHIDYRNSGDRDLAIKKVPLRFGERKGTKEKYLMHLQHSRIGERLQCV